MLAFASVIPLAGWLTERFGAKQVWLASLALFLLGSALAAAAWSIGSLIAFRVVQGLGAGTILPVGQTMLAQAAGPQRMGRVMSVIGVPMLLGPILGPVIGGAIVDEVSWRTACSPTRNRSWASASTCVGSRFSRPGSRFSSTASRRQAARAASRARGRSSRRSSGSRWSPGSSRTQSAGARTR